MALTLTHPVDRLSPARLVVYYLMSCYLYYELGTPVLTDVEFDRLASRLVREWDNAHHPDKRLLSREQVGVSGFAIQYTTRIRLAASQWRKDHNPKDKFRC